MKLFFDLKKWRILGFIIVFCFTTDVLMAQGTTKSFSKIELPVKPHAQEGANWCSIASIQMALEYNLNQQINQCDLIDSIHPNSTSPCKSCCFTCSSYTFFYSYIPGYTKTISPNSRVELNSGIINVKNEIKENNAVILRGQTTIGKVGEHIIIGSGLVNINEATAFLIVNDPYAPCSTSGCKMWINTTSFNARDSRFTVIDNSFFTVKSGSQSKPNIETQFKPEELACINEINEIFNNNIRSKQKSPLTLIHKNGYKIGSGYDVQYGNFFITLLKKHRGYSIEELGFCSYPEFKTVTMPDGTTKALALYETTGNQFQAQLLKIANYPIKFYQFNFNGQKFWSPMYDDHNLQIFSNQAYTKQFILSKFN